MRFYYFNKSNNALLKLTDKLEIIMPKANKDDYLEIDATTYNKVSKEGYAYEFVDNELKLTIDKELRKDYLRKKREPLLIAFDKYKTNVSYGLIQETNHEEMKKWYLSILDLDEDSINNVPTCIKYYL